VTSTGVRWCERAEAAVLAYGGIVHVVQLVAGGYPWAPSWLAAYFISLTALDPLAAVLIALRRRAGLYLGAFVLVTDAAANGYAAYHLHEGGWPARAAQAVITLLAIGAVLLTRASISRPAA
jgi:hypothetical protein